MPSYAGAAGWRSSSIACPHFHSFHPVRPFRWTQVHHGPSSIHAPPELTHLQRHAACGRRASEYIHRQSQTAPQTVDSFVGSTLIRTQMASGEQALQQAAAASSKRIIVDYSFGKLGTTPANPGAQELSKCLGFDHQACHLPQRVPQHTVTVPTLHVCHMSPYAIPYVSLKAEALSSLLSLFACVTDASPLHFHSLHLLPLAHCAAHHATTPHFFSSALLERAPPGRAALAQEPRLGGLMAAAAAVAPVPRRCVSCTIESSDYDPDLLPE
eukprot:6536290-Alexandrium_andersonii.AAC.3